jgi:hypothetical protein
MMRFLDEIAAADSIDLKQLFRQCGIVETPQAWLNDMRRRFL